nr:AMP-binding protein [Paraburkholderia fungorum]
MYTIDPHAPLTLYTSGSSGTPKPIRKSLAQFNAEVHTLEKQWGMLVGNATMLASVPHHHIYGLLFRIMWPLAAGRAFERAISIEPMHLQAQIGQCGATVVVSTPAQLSRWPALPGFAALTPAPRAFFSSGGPLALEAAQEPWKPRRNMRLPTAPRRSKSTAVRRPAASRGVVRIRPMHGNRCAASKCAATKTVR